MDTCPHCGEANENKQPFCTSCGIRIRVIELANSPDQPHTKNASDYGTLSFIVDSVLSDGTLHPSERDYVRTKGVELGFTPDAALAYLEKRLAEHGSVRILDKAASDANLDPVQIFVNRHETLRAGESGIIEFELRNVGVSAYEHLIFSVSSKPPVDEPFDTIKRRHLDTQHTLRESFSIIPKIAGENLIKLRLVFFDSSGKFYAYTGYTTVLVEHNVDLRSTAAPNINVSFAAEKMMGFDASNLVQAALFHGIKEKEPKGQKDEWLRIKLDYDYEAVNDWFEEEHDRPRVVIPRRDASSERCVGAYLAIGSTEPQHSVRFFSKPCVKLGRMGESNDIALVYLPSTKENQDISLGISREHCEIQFDGREFKLRNLSRSGTFVNGSAVEVNRSETLVKDTEILIGLSQFKMKFQIFIEEQQRRTLKEIALPRDRHWEDVHRDLCEKFDYFGKGFVDCARIQRVENAPQNEYCILVKQAFIGRHHENCIVIKDNSVSEIHARIIVSKGQYLLEDCDSENGTFVGSQKLHDREICLLSNGLKVRFGSVECTFQTFPS